MSAARPVVKKILMDQRCGKNSFYAMAGGAIFEYDRDKCSVTDWFPFGMEGKKQKLIYDNVERWPEVDHLRYPQQIDNMKLHISVCCRDIQRHGPTFFSKSDPQLPDQRPEKELTDSFHLGSVTREGSRCLCCAT